VASDTSSVGSEALNATPTEISAPAAPSQVSISAIAVRLLRLMARRKLLLSSSVVCATIAALLSLSPYLATAAVLVELLDPAPDWHRILMIGGAAVAAVIFEKVSFGLATSLSHVVAFSTQRDLRFELARKLARVPLGFLDSKSKGEFRSLLVEDVEILEDGMAHLVPEVSAAVIAPALVLVAMLVLDWRLALLVVLPIVIGMLLLNTMLKRGEGPTRDYFSLQSRMAITAAEMADGLSTVRAFNQEAQATARAAGVFGEMTQFSNAWMRHAVVPGASAQVLLSSHLLFVGPIGLFMAANGWVSIAMLAAFLAIAYGFGDLFAALHGISHRMMQQVQLLERLDALKEAVELPVRDGGKAPADASVRFEQASFSYGTREVLSDITFDVAAGRCLALVGPSGSGKSTIAKLVARFHDVRAGCVKVGSVDVRDLPPDTLNKHIAFVFQDVFLFGGTVAENIRLGRPTATDEEVVAAAKNAQAHDFIQRLPQGYDTILGERGLGLSGGERQRISIARALLKDAPILVLDEATAFADPENEAQIQDAIASLAVDRTLIVIAHRLHTIANADEILVLDRGRIVERGSHGELVARKGLFGRMWAAQDEVRRYRHTSSEGVA